MPPVGVRRGTLGPASGLLLVLAAIGWAGLYPFDLLPPNRVSWVEGDAGLRFEAGGMALSRGEVSWDTSAGPARFEVVLDVEAVPAPVDGFPRELLVLVDADGSPILHVRQQRAHLFVADRVTNPDGERWLNPHRVSDVFPIRERRRIRVVGGERLEVFLDGERVPTTHGYPIPIGRAGEPLSGRVLLGAGPNGSGRWTGTYRGLSLADGARVLARYDFAEGEGRTVRSHTSPALDLQLPPHFRSLLPPLRATPGDARDSVVNFLGFVPFGLLLGVLVRGRSRVLLIVAISGFALSLAIELAQSLMVERVSSVWDLLLNSLGALAGGALALRGER